MSVRRLAAEQPKHFAFTEANLAWARAQIAKYPEGRQASAVIPLLWKAQEQNHGWLPEPAIRAVAEILGMAYIRVLEVATFYTMFSLEPVGRHLVQVCGTTPCMLRGANALKEVCLEAIGPERKVSPDGALSWMEVECLGACANAPMVQVNADYFEDLAPESFEALLEDLRNGRPVRPGPQTGRAASAPEGGPTTLTDPALYDGSQLGSWRLRFAPPAEDRPAPEATGRPDPQPRAEQQSADTPADRATRGEPPLDPARRADAAEKAPEAPSARADVDAQAGNTRPTGQRATGEGLAVAPGTGTTAPSPASQPAADSAGDLPASGKKSRAQRKPKSVT